MAHELEVSVTMVRKINNEDLGYKSYGLRKGQFMSKATKFWRLEKANKLLSCLKHPPTRRFGPPTVQITTPSTFMSGLSLKGMLVKPPTTLRIPWSWRLWRCLPKCGGRSLPLPATRSVAAWRRSSPLTEILSNKFILQYLINIVAKTYISILFLSMFLWEREKK